MFLEIISFSHHLADIANVITKKYFRLPNGEVAKLDQSPVTLADKEIELAWINQIKTHFPQHGIIGEEYPKYQENADNLWVLDPIDGTSSFITGKPVFGNLIGFARNQQPIFGMINQPITQERWFNNQQKQSIFNQQIIKTRKCHNLEEAILCTTSPYFFDSSDEKILNTISKLTKYQKIGGVIYGGDCYNYACLAMGFIDLIIEPGLKIHDFTAIIPIIENAGGVVSDWKGNKLKLQSNAKILASANDILHEKALLAIHNTIFNF
jgi:inositol-phosphate phosphatase/L-galactose 1-phosphate phosphatase/histidinol-phosphatase